MPSSVNKYGQYLINNSGSLIKQISDDNDKYFAVIVKCGHCGTGYFVPIMFSIKSKDLKSAIEIAHTRPKVKRERKTTVIDAFEVTHAENYLIKTINDHDEYVTNSTKKYDLLDRRVIDIYTVEFYNKNNDDNLLYNKSIKTADMYDPDQVLERFYAPYYQGDKLIYNSKINKDTLLHEFFKQKCYKYGIQQNRAFFLSMYYQLYGDDNDLAIKKTGNIFSYPYQDEIRQCEIPDALMKHIENIASRQQTQDNTFTSNKNISKPSQVDKFNRRLQKHQEKVSKPDESPSEREF